MQSPALRFEAVSKRYGDTAAVDAVTLEVTAGSFIALVGASGSGKSTLLKTVTRLIVPDTGRVLIEGDDVAGRPAAALRRHVGYVSQSLGLFPHMTIAENIAIGLRIAGRKSGDRIADLLDLVELPHAVAARMPDQLSGGQRQRVALARALAPGGRVLLLDEALGALDPVTRDSIGTAIRRLHERLGLTTMLVTHDMAEALLLADRVIVMQAGRIVADATPIELATGGGGEAAQALVAVSRAQARRIAELGR